VLTIYFTGLHEPELQGSEFRVCQNYPNPVNDWATITIDIPEKDKLTVSVVDVSGREILKTAKVLDKGRHSFRFTPGGSNLYFFTAQWKGRTRSIKILQTVSGYSNSCSIEYIGGTTLSNSFKAMEDVLEFTYTPGDELLYVGYSEALQSGIADDPEQSRTYFFQFASNIPFPGTPVVTYDGKVYTTIQIFSQCWLQENLDAGEILYGNINQSNNGLTEKYCYNDEQDSCNKYGGLYRWDEIMNYTTSEGAQGICPSGWHLPADEELKILEGDMDSHYKIGDPAWDSAQWRGYDAGLNLKSKWGWGGNGNGTDLYGFSGKPAGFRDGIWGGFANSNRYADWWTSTRSAGDEMWVTHLSHDNSGVGRFDYDTNWGFHVRCLKDN
jgi:uncharacterized protein (TIGR02145 family)